MAERMGTLDPAELVQAAATIKEQVTDAVQRASERWEVERRLQENPWMILGIAAGAGFVLGGGLWPALRPLVKAAGRTALAPSNLLAIAAAFGALRATGADGEDVTEEAGTPTSH